MSNQKILQIITPPAGMVAVFAKTKWRGIDIDRPYFTKLVICLALVEEEGERRAKPMVHSQEGTGVELADEWDSYLGTHPDGEYMSSSWKKIALAYLATVDAEAAAYLAYLERKEAA